MVGDNIRQLRFPGTITGEDTTSYYDRIVHSVVILIERPETFEVIQQIKYYVRTDCVEFNFFTVVKKYTMLECISRKWS